MGSNYLDAKNGVSFNKGGKDNKEYPGIMSKIASDLGFDVSIEEFSKKAEQGSILELTDDDLEGVAGGVKL